MGTFLTVSSTNKKGDKTKQLLLIGKKIIIKKNKIK